MTPLVHVSGGRALYVGPGLSLDPHRNATTTVAIGLAHPFELTVAGEDPICRSVAAIPPDTRHHLRATGPMAFLYLDPHSDDLPATRLPDGLPIDPRAAPRDIVRSILHTLGMQPRSPGRLGPTIRAIEQSPRDFPRVDDAARHAGLSPSRFRAVFRAHMGLPFQRYRLWRRMAVVARAIEAGGSLTDAAFEAGFAGSAHFSTCFRELFGLAPSRLLRLGARFQVDDADSG